MGPATPPRQPWTPISGIVDPLQGAPTVSGTPLVSGDEALVLWQGRSVSSFGLFPASDLRTPVIVTCVFNTPTFFGVRSLSDFEIGGLWDAPIALRDHCKKLGVSGLRMLRSLSNSVPGKCLLLGGDFLLGRFLRGGWCPGGAGIKAVQPLTLGTGSTGSVCGGEDSDDDSIDEVLKQDGQKADDAEVPVQLWDYWFLRTWRTSSALGGRSIAPNWRRGLTLLRKGLIRV